MVMKRMLKVLYKSFVFVQVCMQQNPSLMMLVAVDGKKRRKIHFQIQDNSTGIYTHQQRVLSPAGRL